MIAMSILKIAANPQFAVKADFELSSGDCPFSASESQELVRSLSGRSLGSGERYARTRPQGPVTISMILVPSMVLASVVVSQALVLYPPSWNFALAPIVSCLARLSGEVFRLSGLLGTPMTSSQMKD